MDQSRKPSVSPSSSWQDEGLEFELTDFEEARRILDAESLSQYDVSSVAPPDHWKRLRRGQLPTDRALTGRAIAWLLALPPTVRPQSLSRQFPRITNALAEVWQQPQQCQAALDKLLCDGRKGRKGFPAAVRDELIALRNCCQLAAKAG
jgi:hypothetical protein